MILTTRKSSKNSNETNSEPTLSIITKNIVKTNLNSVTNHGIIMCSQTGLYVCKGALLDRKCGNVAFRHYNSNNNSNYTFPVRRLGVFCDDLMITRSISPKPRHVDVTINPNWATKCFVPSVSETCASEHKPRDPLDNTAPPNDIIHRFTGPANRLMIKHWALHT
jgi:hypothetical protein